MKRLPPKKSQLETELPSLVNPGAAKENKEALLENSM